jgi:hypothetical protein
MGVTTDKAAEAHDDVSMTSRVRRFVLYGLLGTVFLVLNGVGAAPAADTMVLHIHPKP